MASKHWTTTELDSKIVAVKPMDPANEQRVYNKLIKARVAILIGYPFFGFLATHLQFVTDYSISTAATDGTNFYYNPYYIDALDSPCASFVIVHELMHCALDHMHRRGTRQPEKWNYACDYAIHSIIMAYINHWKTKSKQKNALKMPRNCLYNSKYDDMSAEQIYALLPENYKQDAQFGAGSDSSSSSSSSSSNDNNGQGSSQGKNSGKSGSGGSNGGKNKNQTPLDDHSKWYTNSAQRDASVKARTWSGRMLTAAMRTNAQAAGSLPGSLSRLIDKLTKPQKSWRQILMDYLQREVNDFTWNIPDNRYTEELFGDIKMPSFSEEEDVAKDLVFAIDVSGSMSDKQIAMLYSEIVGATQQFKMQGYLAMWDVVCSDFISFDDVTDLFKFKEESVKKMQGFGGGTQVECVFEKIKKEHMQNNITALIIMTDFYLHEPKQEIAAGIPVIWCIVNDDEKTKPSWGQIVRLDNDKSEI